MLICRGPVFPFLQSPQPPPGDWFRSLKYEVLQADLCKRLNDADGAHKAAARHRFLRAEYMLYAGADAALRTVRRLAFDSGCVSHATAE